MRILFVPTYRHPATAGPARASDALGFGVTCADALVSGLRRHGIEVDTVAATEARHTVWVGRVLAGVEAAVRSRRYDVVLAFHAFWPFTADLRRVLDDSVPCPLVTYTHGSHWDPTDLFRFERYPNLRWADLGNLLAADRVLVVSRYLRQSIVDNVRAVSPAAADELAGRIRTVGLPLDLERIDSAYRQRDPHRRTVVFNHAPIAAKRPGVFLDLAADLLAGTAADILLTRHFPAGSPWAGRVRALAEAHPTRVTLGEDLPIDRYYEHLWRGHIQVSTATHESLGVGTLEAMVTGNHCLLPRIGSYPEITAGDPALLYDDLADLRTRLTELVRDDSVVARHNARIRALYSPATVAGAVRDVLAEVGQAE